MAKKADLKIEQQLDGLRAAAESASADVLQAQLVAAFNKPHYRIVALAAKICAEQLLYGFEEPLTKAFQHLLLDPVKRDPNCIGKSALIRALNALDCANIDFYLSALAYRQLEPAWGGSVDTAVDVRASAAVGLAHTSYPRAAMVLASALADAEVPVRRQIVQAIAVLKPEQAEPLLRLKAVVGDAEPEVTAETLSALIHLSAGDTAGFVASFMDADDPILVESAVLALGDSAALETLEPLLARYQEGWLPFKQRQLLLWGIALHRHTQALEWLFGQAGEGSQAISTIIIEALAEFRRNDRVGKQLKKVLDARGDKQLLQVFGRNWD